eukprot:scaffold3931_cov172-Amphora_coffeaeformis.AAC.6
MFDAWANLSAPAAFLVTLSETRGVLASRRGDAKWVRVVKQMTLFCFFGHFHFRFHHDGNGVAQSCLCFGNGSHRMCRAAPIVASSSQI